MARMTSKALTMADTALPSAMPRSYTASMVTEPFRVHSSEQTIKEVETYLGGGAWQDRQDTP